MNSNSCLSTPPARAVSGPPWLGLSVLLLAGFVTIFDLFVVNVALPSMQADLDAMAADPAEPEPLVADAAAGTPPVSVPGGTA